MKRDYNIIGNLIEYHAGKEIKDPILLNDLNTTDPDKLQLLRGWAYGLATPWSSSAMSYILRCHEEYEVDDAHRWSGTFNSIFYDCFESEAICYAETPEEALAKVKQLVETVIEKFAEKDEDEDSD